MLAMFVSAAPSAAVRRAVLGIGPAIHRPDRGDISEAARRLGNDDFTARAPVDGCVGWPDFATTFLTIWRPGCGAIDNSAGSSWATSRMSCAPMTTIKGFIIMIYLNGFHPRGDRLPHGIVSQETGRLKQLVQSICWTSPKLEAGEVPIHARARSVEKLSPT